MRLDHYSIGLSNNAVADIVQAIDRDVEHGEDMLMLGLGTVMLSSTFAPIAPPTVLLPLVALTFAVTVFFTRQNYHNMHRKLLKSMALLNHYEKTVLSPIAEVFAELSVMPLAHDFNLLKNPKRTLKSALGGVLINPLWMPIFYIMGMQINEEKNLYQLNQAIMGVERKLVSPARNDSR